MCGLVGCFKYKTGTSVSQDELGVMLARLVHRGPNGEGFFCEGAIGLGHRRLSIIDTQERSNQPMHTEDGDWVIAYNGELYNYIELKELLEAKGVTFTTCSDTEVVLKAFQTWGVDAFKQFNGMFAFALWQKSTQTLTLARDRLGIKPLYIRETDEGVLFGSEIKSLLALPQVSASLNVTQVDGYLSGGYAVGSETLFEGIDRVLPGQYMQFSGQECHKAFYWDIMYKESRDVGETAYITGTQTLVKDAVELRLRSDVPLGVFLSGGVDSSAIVATMHDLGVSPIHTFSVSWDEGPEFDESEHINAIVEKFGTTHHHYVMTDEDFIQCLPEYIRHMDEPVTEAAGVSLYFLSQKAKEHVTVVLSGEGADEVFGGYGIYAYTALMELYRIIPKPLRFLINPFLKKRSEKMAAYVDWASLPLEERYFGVNSMPLSLTRSLYSDRLKECLSDHSVVKRFHPYYIETQKQPLQRKLQYVDLKSWLVDDLLIKADRMTMAHGLELRVPFLDHRLLDFSATIPSHYRLKKGRTKYLLKRSFEEAIPDSILNRQKQGFPTPIARLMRGALAEDVKAKVTSASFQGLGLFQADLVAKELETFLTQPDYDHRLIWKLYVLALWQEAFEVVPNKIGRV